MKNNKRVPYCIYLPDAQIIWVKEKKELTGVSQSRIVESILTEVINKEKNEVSPKT